MRSTTSFREKRSRAASNQTCEYDSAVMLSAGVIFRRAAERPSRRFIENLQLGQEVARSSRIIGPIE